MVFASLLFIFLFLPLNLILYYSSGNKNYRNWLLVIFSLFFYSWGEPVWIIVMIFSASVDYLNALLIEQNRGTNWAKAGLVSSIVINLGLLILFKYSSFLYENINAIFGLSLDVPTFTLPIGISFYTFQTISYVIDVYRGEVKAQRSYMKFTLFVSLYHQLVAGPIVRYVHIADEIDNRKVDVYDISEGVTRFCFGLFKKVFIANVAGELVGQYLDADMQTLSVSGGWFGLLMFSIQIYFDFSGYSDMAIGLGRMFGFHYHENFNYPYIARSATDFWRRWHISLGTFFRDYIYIPMGGNRKNQMINLFVVWFLTGLWHGASWNFILWGLYFGFLVAIEKLFLYKLLEKLPKFIGHLYLLFAALVGWSLFYFTDMAKLKQFSALVFGFTNNPVWDFELELVIKNHLFWLILAIICCVPVFPATISFLKKRFTNDNVIHCMLIVFSVAFLIICTALLVGKSYNPFLYFRF
ncbi:MAG TPA: MBOAT family O-acyltransferase [Cytophagaceae bacterium]|jgi:alginate O-acetyltransferase complex protein AlgI|nr:MBOAT family O-acyltransferase [Cytophagaceae bacterium]